jgi:glycosyltransferase involved in cell wall biosynthesis
VKISIVVPAFNEEKFLAETLAHIKTASAAFAQIGWEYELIVYDNNSTDRTAEIARSAGAIVVFEPVNQISRARNSGAAAATVDWLVFVDADSHPSAYLFADTAKEIQSEKLTCYHYDDSSATRLMCLTITKQLQWHGRGALRDTNVSYLRSTYGKLG